MPNLQSNTKHHISQPDINTDICVLNVALYYRWSTSSQTKMKRFSDNRVVYDEKANIKDETERLIKSIQDYKGFCSKCNREVRTIYTGGEYLDKGKSGRKVDREEITKLIDDIEKEGKIQAVFTPLSSRIGRRRSVAATIRDRLKDMGVQIYSLHQPVPLKCTDCYDPLDDDSAIINESVSDMQSELELSHIRRNYKIGLPIRIKSGRPSGCCSYGLVKKYSVVGKDSRGNDVIEERYEWDKEKVEIVKRIAREYLEGKGTWSICRDLNMERIPSPQNHEWGRSAIIWILKNPIYYGQIRFGYRPVKGNKRPPQPKEKWMLEKACFPAIWSVDYYERIKKEMARRYHHGRSVSSDSLLIGLLKCGYCHYSMFKGKGGKILKNGKPYEWLGYCCGTFSHRGGCQHNGRKQSEVDRIVLNEILRLANDNTRRVFYEKLSKANTRSIEELLQKKYNRLKQLKKEYGRVIVAYRKGIDTIQEYANNKKRLLPEIDSIEVEVKSLESQRRKNPKFNWKEAYENTIKRFLEHPTEEVKRSVKCILNRLIDRIEFKRKPLWLKVYYKVG